MRTRRIAALAIALTAAGVGLTVAAPRTYPAPSAILVEPLASPYRVHVERMNPVSFTIGGAPSRSGGRAIDRMLELPVVEERGDRVRVVVEGDGVRAMVWVDARDLSWSIARPVRLAGRGDAGVWLSTGAPVTVAGSGRRRTVTYDDGQVKARGAVTAAGVARIFPVSRPQRTSFGAVAEEIRVAPDGAVLHTGPLPVEVLARRGAWIEVEHRARYVRVRGWVAAARLGDGSFGTIGSGGGFGFGMSHTERVTVPAGACLYDRIGGQVVALQRVTDRRYAAGRDGDWWQVYVGTPWGLLLAWGHWLGDDAGGGPLWDRCDGAPAPAPPPPDDDDDDDDDA
jgi:hypothetical protein